MSDARTGLLALLALAALTLSTAAPAALRCGNQLVQEGDHQYDVLQACGPPDYEEKHADAFLQGLGYVGVWEEWYYERGPNKFVHRVTFRDGKVSHIETVGRPERPGGGCDPHMIDTGMSSYELLSKCGEPDSRDSRYEYGRFRVGPHDIVSGKVRIEEWVYDFGPAHFRRYIRLINGRVVKVELGDRGSP